jgi:hypothetical protein
VWKGEVSRIKVYIASDEVSHSTLNGCYTSLIEIKFMGESAVISYRFIQSRWTTMYKSNFYVRDLNFETL